MDTLLLRKLSRKSQLKFGVYCDNSVQDMLTFKKYNYLRWVYFNCDMISFLDDVLDELGITEDYRISKPGKCPELHQKLHDYKMGLLFKKSKLLNYAVQQKIKRKHRITHLYIENMGGDSYTKAALQRKNHGH